MSCCYQTYGFWKLLMLRILISISASHIKQIYSSPSGFAQNHRRQQLHTDLLDIKSLFISLYLSWGEKKWNEKKKNNQKERIEISSTEKLEILVFQVEFSELTSSQNSLSFFTTHYCLSANTPTRIIWTVICFTNSCNTSYSNCSHLKLSQTIANI